MIAVLDTGIANVASVLVAIERIGQKATLSRDASVLNQSSRVILPGVGTAIAFMDRIQSTELQDCISKLTQPVLGICLGMQVLYDYSAEGNISCLGILPGDVQRLHPAGLPVPHMGWNQVRTVKPSFLMRDIPEDSHFYFVHSFRTPVGPETVAFAEYGERVPAVVESSNRFGVQFHPERSGSMGERVLRNFLRL